MWDPVRSVFCFVLFFLMKDLDYAYVNGKEPAEEKLVMQKSIG